MPNLFLLLLQVDRGGSPAVPVDGRPASEARRGGERPQGSPGSEDGAGEGHLRQEELAVRRSREGASAQNPQPDHHHAAGLLGANWWH